MKCNKPFIHAAILADIDFFREAFPSYFGEEY